MAERISVLGQIELITVTPAVRQERGLKVERGALVFDIEPQAQRVTGLRPGDVIIQINRQRITTADQVRRAFRGARGGGAIRLYFARGEARGYSDFRVR
jgi:serine protease Do